MADLARRAGNVLYKFGFPIYRPLYSAFKAHADRAARRLLTEILNPGSVVVDAGANIGVYSQLLSRLVGAGGMVHSFEPAPDNFARLRTATADLPNVRANQLAVSDTTGEQLLYVSDALNIDHRTYPLKGEARRTIKIHSIRVDDYFKPKEGADLIKLDIQGYELHALRGAERVLLEHPKIKLLLEFWPHGLRAAGESPEELLAFLKRRGFTVFTISENDLLEYQPIAFNYDAAHFLNLFAQRAEDLA